MKTRYASLIPAALLATAAQAAPPAGRMAPEFTHRGAGDWINSPPLALAELRGSVVLVDFWAFECWNCYRSFPWLNALAERYRGRGLRVVSVHTPELPAEHDRDELVRKVRQYGLTNPVMLDDDSSYWNAMDNRYWPAFYLVDRGGAVRAVFVGETHAGDDNARAMENAVERLLSEPAPGPGS